jgi:NADPH:quinone reductase-like Zn-dependent oxidoreductase
MNPSPVITPTKEVAPKKANPMNLTDDQMLALIVAACTAAAISKPVQEKLASTVPQFLNAQGSRSVVGLASTGAVAALLFYIAQRYV